MRTAVIVGAGIGGLAAGIALRRAGWRTRIFERAAAPRELGFALNLAPNAVAALRALGVADRIEAEAHRMRVGELRRMDGRPLKRLDIGAMAGTPSLIALRQALHGALLDATPAEDLALGSAGVGVERDGEGATLILAGGRRERGDILIGADGLGSAIRRHLHPADPPPRESGLCAVRGVVRGVTDTLGGLSGTIYLGPACEAAAVRASADAIYWFVSVRASSVTTAAGDAAAAARLMLARLPPAFRAVAEPTPAGDLRLDRLVDRDPIAAWGEGPITLLGDAAHPMLPQTGQGAAQALEDAVALGAALAPADAGVAALRDYERIRSARTAALVRRGRRLAAALAIDSALVDWLRATVIRATPSRVLVNAMLRV
jgi:2-polyprenyl-6-methoxyphenol hydroxylase-like FAD-dependent oxidoreductase